MNIFVSTWALLVGGLVTTLPMIYLRVKEHTEEHEEISNILYVHVPYDAGLILMTSAVLTWTPPTPLLARRWRSHWLKLRLNDRSQFPFRS